jgi:hypothetical protein
MGNALQWFRSRRQGLARVLLAAFCMAWLQVAVLPCTMAHAAAPVGGHDHADGPADVHAAVQHGAEFTPPCHGSVVDEDCLYCLGDERSSGCDYPHEARADLRDAGSLLPLLSPASFGAILPELSADGGTAADRRHARGPADISGSLQTLYCRRLR